MAARLVVVLPGGQGALEAIAQERMAQQRYDASTKSLFEYQPEALLYLVDEALLEYEVSVLDSDLAVTAAADKVLRIDRAADEGGPWVSVFDMQAGPNPDLPVRATHYKVLAIYRHGLPARSVIILLSPRADHPSLTGRWEQPGDEHVNAVSSEYDVIRIWQVPTDKVLAGPVGLLPLAPLTLPKQTSEAELSGVIGKIAQRFEKEAPEEKVADLWTATHFLMGLKYPDALIELVLQGVHGMKESVTYQRAVQEGLEKGREQGLEQGLEKGLEKGRIDGERRLLLRLGTKRFGPPSPTVAAALENIDSLERLEELGERIFDAESWESLLFGTNGTTPQS